MKTVSHIVIPWRGQAGIIIGKLVALNEDNMVCIVSFPKVGPIKIRV